MQIRLSDVVLFALFFFLLLGLVSGCSRKENKPVQQESLTKPVQAVEPLAKVFLHEAIPLQRVEVSSEALAVWRQYSEQKPTLLLISNNPMLISVPEPLRDEVASLINTEAQTEIAERSTLRRSAPLIMPAMTVDAALRNGWFKQLAWAIPLREAAVELSQDQFRKQMQETGIATADEVSSVTVVNNLVAGALRKTPFVAAALPNLPALTGPVIIHFDQSYFKQFYKNEIATPIFPAIIETLKALRGRKIPVLAATFAYGNLEKRISLEVRFIGEVLQALVEKPERLDKPLPKQWKLQADILYLNNFFKKEKILELALEIEKAVPESAWAKFSLFRAAAENSMGTAALGYLAEAVLIDQVYALEYLSLSDMAFEKRRPDEALRMLKLAADAFPNNHMIMLQMAALAAELGEVKTALHLVEPLQKLNWSKVYYPAMPEGLASIVEQLSNTDEHLKKDAGRKE